MTRNPVPWYRWWSGLSGAVHFLLTLRHSGHDPGDSRRSLERGGTVFDLYAPGGRAAGTIVFIHGMAAKGYRDPRVVDLCVALAAAGFRVVVPDIPSVRALKIERGQPREVERLIGAVACDEVLVPERRCAVMAVSFSSAFVIHAAGDPETARFLSALCLIGGYSDLDAVCRFLIRDEHADRYGFLLIARSYFAEVAPESPKFVAALERCVAASVDKGPDWDPASELDTDIEDEARLAGLLREPGRREVFVQQVAEAAAADWSGYQVRLDLSRGDLPVLMIHGRDDRVIPAEESRRLAGHFAERGIPHRLAVTSLLTHGDSRLHVSELPEIARMLGAMAWFFAAAGA